RGWRWDKYRRHFGPEGPVLVWQAATRVMTPRFEAQEIADAEADDAEAAASEYGALFRSDLETYVSIGTLDAVTTPGVEERPPLPGISYTGFLDAAAGSGKDSFTAAVAHVEGETVVLDAVREVKPPFDPTAIARELSASLRSYGVRSVGSDKYAGAWVTASFEPHGVVVEQTAEPKSALYLAALPLLTSHRVDLLDLPALRAQLTSLERRRRAGGR